MLESLRAKNKKQEENIEQKSGEIEMLKREKEELIEE